MTSLNKGASFIFNKNALLGKKSLRHLQQKKFFVIAHSVTPSLHHSQVIQNIAYSYPSADTRLDKSWPDNHSAYFSKFMCTFSFSYSFLKLRNLRFVWNRDNAFAFAASCDALFFAQRGNHPRRFLPADCLLLSSKTSWREQESANDRKMSNFRRKVLKSVQIIIALWIQVLQLNTNHDILKFIYRMLQHNFTTFFLNKIFPK